MARLEIGRGDYTDKVRGFALTCPNCGEYKDVELYIEPFPWLTVSVICGVCGHNEEFYDGF